MLRGGCPHSRFFTLEAYPVSQIKRDSRPIRKTSREAVKPENAQPSVINRTRLNSRRRSPLRVFESLRTFLKHFIQIGHQPVYFIFIDDQRWNKAQYVPLDAVDKEPSF